ncbi:MAG: alpha/beta fold hydrolase [Sandaracinaceae bacterium]|nr:alpha/beta fold hydrolase [Sandaracinaceae bacterium]
MGKRRMLFIHGMFLTGRSWAPWVEWFGARGIDAIAPDWPGREGTAAERRASPAPELRALRLRDVVDRFEAIARAEPELPLLVGHSMGGLVVQLLLARGAGAAGVALSSAPPEGVRSFAWSHLVSNAAVLWPGSAPIEPSIGWWRDAFWHTGAPDDVRAAYDQHVVPESRLVGRGPLGPEAKIDFARPRPPLLFVAAAKDRIIPPALNRANAARYRPDAGVTDFVELPERTHYLVGQPGWEEVAERTLDWLREREV